MQDNDGQATPTHSVSAGLDYTGVGPEHAYLHALKRASYTNVSDDEAVAAFHLLARTEGIIPALESSHAIAHVCKVADRYKGKTIIVNLSGRGDKDIGIIQKYQGGKS